MKNIILLLSLFISGCFQHEDCIKFEKVKISQGCYYKLGNKYTIYDIYCTDKDINSNGVVIVEYEVIRDVPSVISVKDDN